VGDLSTNDYFAGGLKYILGEKILRKITEYAKKTNLQPSLKAMADKAEG